MRRFVSFIHSIPLKPQLIWWPLQRNVMLQQRKKKRSHRRANEWKENKWIMNVEWCDSVQLNKHDKLTFILFENVINKNRRIEWLNLKSSLSHFVQTVRFDKWYIIWFIWHKYRENHRVNLYTLILIKSLEKHRDEGAKKSEDLS